MPIFAAMETLQILHDQKRGLFSLCVAALREAHVQTKPSFAPTKTCSFFYRQAHISDCYPASAFSCDTRQAVNCELFSLTSKALIGGPHGITLAPWQLPIS